MRLVAGAQPRITERVATEAFRPDLWSRLARFIIQVPPLRERPADIPILARHFADQAGGAHLALTVEVDRADGAAVARERA